MNIKELAEKKRKFTSGHRMCGGCAAPIIVNTVLSSTDDQIVVVNATGCLEVASTIYPYSSWGVPWMHSAFENAASSISGVVAAYNALKKKGKMKKEVKFVAFGGDGGTYDIGLQALSGALERGHDFVYVCYDNAAYCNTGGQRSSATPFGASATTDPAGSERQGKMEFRKNLIKIAAAHGIPYAAQASVANLPDLSMKAKKALDAKGPAFLLVFSTCPTIWGTRSEDTISIAKAAVDSCFWPLYEIENGKYKVNYKPSNKLPVDDFLKPQRRFKHLFSLANKKIVKDIQEHVDNEWEKLLALEKC